MAYDKTTHNPNCDGEHCHNTTGETRVLPIGADSNAILCRACYRHEINFRIDANDLNRGKGITPYALPAWESLKVNTLLGGKLP